MTEGTILATVFDRDTTLGLVRFAVRRVLPRLQISIHEGYGDSATAINMDDGFEGEVLERVDRLFDATT